MPSPSQAFHRGNASSGGASKPAKNSSEDLPAGLSRSEWTQIRRSIEASEYHAARVAKPGEAPTLHARNRQQRYGTTFRDSGIEIVPESPEGPWWQLGLSVTGYGYEGDVRPLRPADPQAEKDRIEYHRGPVTEWYVNRPEGLEQGFELRQPETIRSGRPLVITMAAHGSLSLSSAVDGVVFATDRGELPLIRYAGLKAWDADGRLLSSRLQATDLNIQLVIEAQAARFPVTVDPTFVHQARLEGHGDPFGEPDAAFGFSVAVSGDKVAVGAPYADTHSGVDAGAVYVFERSGSSWIMQVPIRAADFPAAGDLFGSAVAISGETLVVGAPRDDNVGGADAGAAYVFILAGGFASQAQQLLASDGASGARFGSSVSVAGGTIVVGAESADTSAGADAGAAYVFVGSTSTAWTEQQKLLASDAAAGDAFGNSVSLDGETVVVGAAADSNPAGAAAGSAYVFVRSGTSWSEQQKLVASDGAAGDRFATSVSVSADTVLAGAVGDDTVGGADAGSAYVFVRSGSTWAEQQKLLASDAVANQGFGISISVSGDRSVVGAHLDDNPAGTDAGAAYVFARSGSTWSEQQKLVAPDGAANDRFGDAVSIAGDTLIVGALLDATPPGGSTGSAHVFVASGISWEEQEKLVPFASPAGDLFGHSVAVSGDTAVIGAASDDTSSGGTAGSAYVFTRSGSVWTEQQKLMPVDGAHGSQFGWSTAIVGDTIVVGAWLDDTPAGMDAGSAYVFVRSGTSWMQQQKLLPSDGAPFDAFGTSVSISGDTVVVGAYNDYSGAATGSAYVFVRSGTTWVEQQKLVASDGMVTDYFGYSVSISGDSVAVGAYSDDTAAGADAGSAYVFVRTGSMWTEQQKLLPADGSAGAQFGRSVSVSGDTVVCGANYDSTPSGPYAGSAYVFVRSGVIWSQKQKLLPSIGTATGNFGWAVAVSGDTAAVGEFQGGMFSHGAAYIFVRSGTTWVERDRLLPAPVLWSSWFGWAVGVSGNTVIIGAPIDKAGLAPLAGSSHVYVPQAELAVTKTDGQTTAVPGEPLSYTIVVSNAGPGDVIGATVTDALPAALLGAGWTCSASAGSSCSPSGSGNINDTVNLAAGGTASYIVIGTVAAGATGTISNTVTVTPPGGVSDPDPDNNVATDVDTLTPETDLALTKEDSADPVNPGDALTYSAAVINNGPSDATGVTVVDSLPGGVTFVSSVPGPPTCSFAGGALTCGLGALPAGGTSSVTINVTVNAGVRGMLVNTATVSGSETDPDPDNNTDSAVTSVGRKDGELTHGTNEVFDLAALPGPVGDEDVFRMVQKPYSSYEIVVDATSGDIGAGNGPLLERVDSDGVTILQSSVPVGAGLSRSLRWMNGTPQEVESQTIRVRSAGCTTDCGPDDVYRIRAYETTYSIPRFNNTGTQVTVLVLQNSTDDVMGGSAYFWDSSGTLVGTVVFDVSGRKTVVFNTSAIPGVNGVAGTITVANTMRYGEIAGKTVALEPATGFSFDTPLLPRPR